MANSTSTKTKKVNKKATPTKAVPSKYTAEQLKAEVEKDFYDKDGIDAEVLLAKANACYAKVGTKIKLILDKVTPNVIRMRNEYNEIQIRFSRLKNGKWNYNGKVVYTDGTVLRDTTIVWEKDGDDLKPKLYNRNCLDQNKELQNRIDDDTFDELMPFLYHSSCSGPLWLWLHGLSMENHIRKMLQPIFFDLKWTKMDLSLQRYFPELAASNLKEYYKTFGINDARLRRLLQENTEKIEPYVFITRTKEVSSLLKAGVDPNHVEAFWPELMRISDRKNIQNLLNLLDFFSFEQIMTQLRKADDFERNWNMYSDIARQYKQLKDLNPNIIVPKVNNLTEYHDLLSKLICTEESRREAAPFDYNPGEKEFVESINIDGYTVQLPESKATLRYWGNLQGHCIGTYTCTTTKRLMSIWKDDKIVSCLELLFNWDQKMNQKTGEREFVLRDNARIVQHRGHKNYDPKIEVDTRLALEKALEDYYNLKPQLTREKTKV